MKIKAFFYRNKQENMTFSKLLPSQTKEDKISTFIPLLHLTTQRKIDIEQQEHFGEINILLNTHKETDNEIEAET